VVAGQQIQGGFADLRIPGYTDPRFDWLGSFQASHERPEAYDALTIGGSAGVEYEITSELSTAGGLALEWLDIDEGIYQQRYFLVGVPLKLIYDTTDDLLDPSRGTRLNLSATPYIAVSEAGDNFTVTTLTDSAYLSVFDENRVVLAGWGRVGSILGADHVQNVPAPKRLYGGGANSVRAYGYQELGRIGRDGDPVGGQSQLEGGLELRWRMFEDFGAVAFFEGGQVYENSVPDFNDRFQWGGGMGLRYFTPFGPLRADFAFPVNPRDNDAPFQFYIGLGQAF
jgi:translocation and assembly module TamA